jgi:hypothetical protein
LIVISVNDPTDVVVWNVSVLQNPDRIVSHNISAARVSWRSLVR